MTKAPLGSGQCANGDETNVLFITYSCFDGEPDVSEYLDLLNTFTTKIKLSLSLLTRTAEKTFKFYIVRKTNYISSWSHLYVFPFSYAFSLRTSLKYVTYFSFPRILFLWRNYMSRYLHYFLHDLPNSMSHKLLLKASIVFRQLCSLPKKTKTIWQTLLFNSFCY